MKSGVKLASYRIEKLLGHGASAEVYLAVNENDSQKVALKIFHPAMWKSEDFRKRAFAEVKTVSSLNHPNIVKVIEPLWECETPGVVMEYVDGDSLEKFQARLPYILPEVAALMMIEILAALEEAHKNGVIHRDLKPANVLVRTDGRIFVSDFGLAKVLDMTQLTLSGSILGSPDFMSPEQARGEAVTAHSDIFSAAALFYFLVTGTRPFSRSNPLATLAAVVDARPEAPQNRNPKLSSRLSQIILKGISKEARERFQTAQEFRQEIENYLASLGLDTESFNLQNWIKNPSEFIMVSMQKIASSLSSACEGFIDDGQPGLALKALSHLSTVAPEYSSISQLMKKIETRRTGDRRKRVLAYSAVGLLGFALAGGAVYSLLPSENGSVVASSMHVKSELKKDLIGKKSAAPRVVAQPEPPKPPSRKKEKAKSVKLGTVRFMVPDSVTVFWDGKKINPARLLRDQKIGMHELVMRRRGAKPIIAEVEVKGDQPTVIKAF